MAIVSTGRLAAARAATERGHVDTYTVYRDTGEKTEDPLTLAEVPVYEVVHENVRGKIQDAGSQNRVAQVPGHGVAVSELAWHTSLSVTGILTDDEVECTAVGPGSDPENVGRRLRITGPFVKSVATARRFRVEELS